MVILLGTNPLSNAVGISEWYLDPDLGIRITVTNSELPSLPGIQIRVFTWFHWVISIYWTIDPIVVEKTQSSLERDAERFSDFWIVTNLLNTESALGTIRSYTDQVF
jgi:hypothetical protein